MNRHDWNTIKGRKYNADLKKKNMDSVFFNIEIILEKHLNEISKNLTTKKLSGSNIEGKLVIIH